MRAMTEAEWVIHACKHARLLAGASAGGYLLCLDVKACLGVSPHHACVCALHASVRVGMQTQMLTHVSAAQHPHKPLATLFEFMLQNGTIDESYARLFLL